MDLSVGAYLAGAVMLAGVITVCTISAHLVLRRAAPSVRGTPRLLALFMLATGFIALVHLAPGIFGVLSRGTVIACAVLLLVVVLGLAWGGDADAVAEPDRSSAPPMDADPRWARALALAGVAAATAVGVAFVFARSSHLITAVDATTTHLPLIARWIQGGSVWPIVQYTPDLSNGTYPENGTLMMLAAVLPWRSAFAVRYVDVAFLAALAVAIAAVARELRAPWSAAALAGAAFTTLAAVNEPALEQAQVDAPMLAWFTIGVLFLVRALRNKRREELVLAGVGLGLAFGTKWYAVIALTGGFWLVRNWVQVGNPVHPAAVHIAGITVFDAPVDTLREKAGFTVSDYLTDGSIWRHWFFPAYRNNFGILGPLLLLAALAALVAGIVRWRRTRAGSAYAAPVAGAAAALLMGLLYLKLPDTAFGPPGKPVLVGANARYLVPALLGGAVLAPWLATLGRRWLAVVVALLTAGLVDGLFRSYHDISVKAAVLAVFAVIAGAAAARVARVLPAAAVMATALVVFIGAGFAARHQAYAQSYAFMDPTVAWLDAHAPSGAKVALGKTWDNHGISPVTPAFGPRLGNHVTFLGHFVHGTMRQWRTRADFTAQLQRGDFDVIILGRGAPARKGGENPEAGWVRALGYREVAASARLVLFVRGESDAGIGADAGDQRDLSFRNGASINR